MVDSGNVGTNVYAPSVEFTLAADPVRDLQAADADHEAFLAAKPQQLHFVSRHYEDLTTTSEAAGWRVYRRLLSGGKTSVARTLEQLASDTIEYREIS